MSFVRKLFDTLKKLAGIGRAAAVVGLVGILVVAFAGILAMRSNASTQQKTPVATSASFASASSTETPTLAPTAVSQVVETPTDVSTPSNVQQYPVTMPFTVDHIEIVENDWGGGGIGARGPFDCEPDGEPADIQAAVFLVVGSPSGKATYRWHFSDRTATATASQNLLAPTNLRLSTLVATTWRVPVKETASALWAQLEIVTPNHVYSPRVKFTITCNFGITSVDPQVSPADYDCSGADEQTFVYSATVSLLPAAGSHTITYYWLRYDGTKSSSFSTTASPFDTSVTLQSDSFSLTKSAAMSNRAYWEELVITSPHSPASPDQLKRIVYKSC